MSNTTVIDQSQLGNMIRMSIRTDAPLFIWGTPGIGKSDIAAQAAADEDATLIDIRLGQYDAVDLRGLPDVANGMTVWAVPSTLPFVGSSWDPTTSADAPPAERPILLFLDEAMQAPQAVQSVAFQLVLERRVGEHRLLPNVRIIAASNRETDRAGVQKMLTPLANRFLHVEVEPSLEAWKSWALNQGISPTIVGFLNFRPNMLDGFEAAAKSGSKAFPTPRSWAMADRMVKAAEEVGDAGAVDTMVSAAVGVAAATEFLAFHRMARTMPTLDQICEDPEGTFIPEKPDERYAVCAMLAQRTTTDTAGPVVTYMRRFPEEYAVMWMADISRHKARVVLGCKELIEYQTEMHQSIYG